MLPKIKTERPSGRFCFDCGEKLQPGTREAPVHIIQERTKRHTLRVSAVLCHRCWCKLKGLERR